MSEPVLAGDLKPPEKPAEIPDVLPLLLLRELVPFPMSIIPMRITRESEGKLIDEAVMGNKLVALLTKREGVEGEGLDAAYEVGCVGRILQLQHVPDTTVNVVMQAIRRFRVEGLVKREPYMAVKISTIEEPVVDEKELGPLVQTVRNQMGRLIELSPNIPEGAAQVLENVSDSGFLADLIGANLGISIEEKQKLLETLDRKERLERLTYLLAREVEMLELSNKIQSNAKSSIDQSQREYFLRQQLRAIK